MRITSIQIGAAKTINLGNYQSLRIEAQVTAEIAEGDDITTATAGMQGELRRLLEETHRAQRKEPDAKPDPAPAPARTSNPLPGAFKPATPSQEY